MLHLTSSVIICGREPELNETKTQQTIRYTKQHLRINTHLDSLCAVTDVHAHTHTLEDETDSHLVY